MIVVKIFIGVFFFVLGWVYFYKPNLILQLNKTAREILFNDRQVLFERKKLAILFFCLSFVALYMGMTSLARIEKNIENNTDGSLKPNGYTMYMAMQDYCSGRYQEALEKYQKILKSEPYNTRALKRIAHTYYALGQSEKARDIWQRLYMRFPNDKEIQDNIK